MSEFVGAPPLEHIVGMREAIAALTDRERFAAVDMWGRVQDQTGRGSSGWVGYLIEQRTGELTGRREVAWGPVRMLRPAEIEALGVLCGHLAVDPELAEFRTPALTAYWACAVFMFAEAGDILASSEVV